MRTRVATLPAHRTTGVHRAARCRPEPPSHSADYAGALAAIDLVSARAQARAGNGLLDEWRATHDADNQVGELLAGAATLKFSIAYLRDYGQ